MPLSYKIVKLILSEHGFTFDRQKGSHEQRMKNGKTATIPFRTEYPTKTGKSILLQISVALGCNYKDLIRKYGIKL